MKKLKIIISCFVFILFSAKSNGDEVKEVFFNLNPFLRDLDGWFFIQSPEAELYYKLEFLRERKKYLYLEFDVGQSSFESIEAIDKHIERLTKISENAAMISRKRLPQGAQTYLVSFESDNSYGGDFVIYGEIIAKDEAIIGSSVYTAGVGKLDFGQGRVFEMGGLIQFGVYEKGDTMEAADGKNGSDANGG